MSYQHDIFISYRRSPETHRWIRKYFLPALEHRVEFELGRKPDIYLDDLIETGASWPDSLGAALGSSRVIVVLWSANYFNSVWCTEEFSHMLGREETENVRTVDRRGGLVIPMFIHDGKEFPPDLGHIQRFELQKYFIPMQRGGRLHEKFEAAIVAQAPAIAARIRSAPPWRKAWQKEAAATLFKRFYQQAALQTTLPRFTDR